MIKILVWWAKIKVLLLFLCLVYFFDGFSAVGCDGLQKQNSKTIFVYLPEIEITEWFSPVFPQRISNGNNAQNPIFFRNMEYFTYIGFAAFHI